MNRKETIGQILDHSILEIQKKKKPKDRNWTVKKIFQRYIIRVILIDVVVCERSRLSG